MRGQVFRKQIIKGEVGIDDVTIAVGRSFH